MSQAIAKNEIKSAFLDEIISLTRAIFEAEEVLFDRQCDGLRYWHFVRFSCIHEIFAAKGWVQISDRRKQTPLWSKSSIFGSLLKNGLLYGLHKDRKPTDVLIVTAANKKVNNSGYHDPYLDDWLPDLSFSYTTWEMPIFWRHKSKRDQPNLFYPDVMLLKALIRQSLFREHCEFRREIKFLRDFVQQFDVTLSEKRLRHILTYILCLRKAAACHLEAVLRAKKPKLILLVNHYDPANMFITSAAHSLGSYVVELQHGTLGPYHIPYNFHTDVMLNTLPNEIFTFGDFWNRTTGLSRNGVRLTAVGWPYFEKQVGSIRPQKRDKRTRILIINQELIGHRMAGIATKLAKQLGRQHYEVLFKLHPREYENWRMKYPELVGSDVNVNAQQDLYDLLSNTDIHIGVYSTAVIESLAFNKKLILIESYGLHFVSELITSGRALFARNVEEVVEAIHSPVGFAGGNQINHFWEPNSSEKILSRIGEILA